jgi:hypothetical protein
LLDTTSAPNAPPLVSDELLAEAMVGICRPALAALDTALLELDRLTDERLVLRRELVDVRAARLVSTCRQTSRARSVRLARMEKGRRVMGKGGISALCHG